MKERIKELWCDRLLVSKQTTGCLHDSEEGSYCCLGLLTQCYLNETGKTWMDVCSLPTDGMYGKGECLPKEVAEWAGLGLDIDPYLDIYGDESGGGGDLECMTHLNDNAGYTFEQLAALIKEQL